MGQFFRDMREAHHRRSAVAWTRCYLYFLVPLFVFGVCLYLYAMLGNLTVLRVFPSRIPDAFDYALRFGDLTEHSEQMLTYANSGMRECFYTELRCNNGETVVAPGGEDRPYMGDERSNMVILFDQSLSTMRDVGLDPYLGRGELQTLGERLDSVDKSLSAIRREETMCTVAAVEFCSIFRAVSAARADVNIVDDAILSLLQLHEIKIWNQVFNFQGTFLYAAPFILAFATLCFTAFWAYDAACCLGCGGSFAGGYFASMFFVTVLPYAAGMGGAAFIGAEILVGGLLKIQSLPGDPGLKVVIEHIQDRFPALWDYLFGELSENGMLVFFMATVALSVYSAGMLMLATLICVLMPYHGDLPTPEELMQEVLGGGWPDAPESELRELRQLRPCQLLALGHVRRLCRRFHDEAMPRLRRRVAELGFKPEDLDRALAWIREQAPIIIHVKLEVCCAELALDSHYRNQFQINRSGGTFDNKRRMTWEDDLFGSAYKNATPFERCKYGAMNVICAPEGVKACKQYGTSYLQIKGARLRTTFSAQDSAGLEAKDLATVDYYAHVFLKYSDAELKQVLRVADKQLPVGDSTVISTYKEAQIHGEIRLSEHVEFIFAAPLMKQTEHRQNNLQALGKRCRAPVIHIEEGRGPSAARAGGSSSSTHRIPDTGTASTPDKPGSEAERRARQEFLIVVRGVVGADAALVNGVYISDDDKDALSHFDRSFKKVGDPHRYLRTMTFPLEGGARHRCAISASACDGTSEGSVCLQSTQSYEGKPPEDPGDVGSWSAWRDGGWEPQEGVRVVCRIAPSGTRRRLETNSSGLPSGWDFSRDPTRGKIYYFDWETMQTSWKKPVAEETDGGRGSEVEEGMPPEPLLQHAGELEVTYIYELEIEGGWVPFEGISAEVLRKARESSTKVIRFEERGFPYALDLERMGQRNLKTGRVRQIRCRTESYGPPEGESFEPVPAAPSEEAPVAPVDSDGLPPEAPAKTGSASPYLATVGVMPGDMSAPASPAPFEPPARVVLEASPRSSLTDLTPREKEPLLKDTSSATKPGGEASSLASSSAIQSSPKRARVSLGECWSEVIPQLKAEEHAIDIMREAANQEKAPPPGPGDSERSTDSDLEV